LKLSLQTMAEGCGVVAPRAGAWIETLNGYARPLGLRVAPRAGAWLQTENGRGHRAPTIHGEYVGTLLSLEMIPEKMRKKTIEESAEENI
jgi:hypothetical protein